MESEKLSLKDFVYISTLSDLGMTFGKNKSTMLKLDISPGDYGFLEFHDGYILAKYGYYPDLRDIVKIFNTRDGDKGLSGTYWDGGTKNKNHMRLYNEWLRFHLHKDYLDRHYDCDTDEEEDDMWSEESDSGMENDVVPSSENFAGAKKLTQLEDYHNLPVFFYLNQSLNNDDLYQLSLKHPIKKKIGNVQRVWRVVHDVYGDIGVAVLQKNLYDLMGDQAGLAFFATTMAQAFGNFDVYKIYDDNLFANEWVVYPRYQFNCKFNPCNCDWRYDSIRDS